MLLPESISEGLYQSKQLTQNYFYGEDNVGRITSQLPFKRDMKTSVGTGELYA